MTPKKKPDEGYLNLRDLNHDHHHPPNPRRPSSPPHSFKPLCLPKISDSFNLSSLPIPWNAVAHRFASLTPPSPPQIPRGGTPLGEIDWPELLDQEAELEAYKAAISREEEAEDYFRSLTPVDPSLNMSKSDEDMQTDNNSSPRQPMWPPVTLSNEFTGIHLHGWSESTGRVGWSRAAEAEYENLPDGLKVAVSIHNHAQLQLGRHPVRKISEILGTLLPIWLPQPHSTNAANPDAVLRVLGPFAFLIHSIDEETAKKLLSLPHWSLKFPGRETEHAYYLSMHPWPISPPLLIVMLKNLPLESDETSEVRSLVMESWERDPECKALIENFWPEEVEEDGSQIRLNRGLHIDALVMESKITFRIYATERPENLEIYAAFIERAKKEVKYGLSSPGFAAETVGYFCQNCKSYDHNRYYCPFYDQPKYFGGTRPPPHSNQEEGDETRIYGPRSSEAAMRHRLDAGIPELDSDRYSSQQTARRGKKRRLY
ncbi:hypothetical protein DL96DRAFT_1711252 [Flagelloscypha sp. PMI_526]|nr:hypothetical protein DL96DRAFT_1711252 [Flagelloscypha sp. PMI_526]